MDVSASTKPTQPFASGMLKGRAAVVTGSTSGIGLGIAGALAAQGADVLLNGFGDPAEIDRVRSSLADAHGVLVSYSAADMARPEEINGMIEQATRDLGGVDILVNNAGIQHTAPVREFPMERWNAILAINLTAAFCATQAVLPQMESRGWGDHQHRLGARARRVDAQGRLRRGQARGARADQGGRARNGDHRRDLQRHLPGLGADAPGAEADR